MENPYFWLEISIGLLIWAMTLVLTLSACRSEFTRQMFKSLKVWQQNSRHSAHDTHKILKWSLLLSQYFIRYPWAIKPLSTRYRGCRGYGTGSSSRYNDSILGIGLVQNANRRSISAAHDAWILRWDASSATRIKRLLVSASVFSVLCPYGTGRQACWSRRSET
jgi:hypothetical protein